MKVNSILVSQPKPESEKNPYTRLADELKITLDFRPFIHIEGIPIQEFRKNRVHFTDYTAVILTSKNAVDHFFRICSEARISPPDAMKYFCTNEATAHYLQKYIVYRKRKIFFGKGRFADLIEIMAKHKKEKYVLPCSNVLKPTIPDLLEKHKFNYTKANIYKTVVSDLSDLEDVYYDILVFFSPSGIKSLFENFPDFKQNKTRIAAFGSTTIKAVEERGLKVDITAPSENAPSMPMAIKQYVNKVNKLS